MVEYGVTNTGFVVKSYSNISDDIENRLKILFGEEVDLTPGSPLKLLADLFSVELSKLWVELENTYDSGFINLSSNESLNNLGQIVNIDRRDGTVSTGEITFMRTIPLPSGSPRMIAANTSVQTADIIPLVYNTTNSVYFEATVSAEEFEIGTSAVSVYDADNYIHSITLVSGSNGVDYTPGVTFNNREITLLSSVPSGSTIYTTYQPLSITADIQSDLTGVESNTGINTITVQTTPLDFVHSITNESILDNGTSEELDFALRERIKSASIATGNATEQAIRTNLQSVTGVTNVIVESPYLRTSIEGIIADGTDTITVTNIPLSSITSASGSVTGAFTVDSFDVENGEITFTVNTSNGETVTTEYIYESLGEIKVYVNGGVVGDEDTTDTIVYTLDNTRAAGIKSIGYATGDVDACGSNTAEFSWFYRPGNAEFDITITLVWDTDSTLSTAEKTNIKTNIVEDISTFINGLSMYDKVYKNKILQIAISENSDIDNATLTSWALDNVAKDISLEYLQGAETEIPFVDSIIVL